jgi:hypothetical protein
VVALAVFAGGGASAEANLELGLDAGIEYDDNILFSSTAPLSDFTLRPGPRIRIEEETGRLKWHVGYQPTYEKFLRYSEFDGWDHVADANVTWEMTPRTTFTLRDRYGNYNRYATALAETSVEGPIVEPGFVRFGRRYEQNNADASIDHFLTKIDRLTLSAFHVYSDQRSDITAGGESEVFGANLRWLRGLGMNDRAGLTVAYTQQQFESVDVRRQSESEFYNVSLDWFHTFDPTFNFQASAGPALVSSPQDDEFPSSFFGPLVPIVSGSNGVTGPALLDTCSTLSDGTPILSGACEAIPISALPNPALVFITGELPLIGGIPEADDSSLTYFATLIVSKHWRRLSATFRYTRDASTALDTTGEVRDLVLANLTWRPGDRWVVTWEATWQRREQENEGFVLATVLGPLGVQGAATAVGVRAVETGSRIHIDQWSLSLNVDYRWSKRVTLYTRAFWMEQTLKGDVPFSQTVDRLTILMGVRFFLDPIPLPI